MIDCLSSLGFERTGRVWYHVESEIAVEVPSNNLKGSREHVNEISLPSGRPVYVIGVEDIIIHRLEGIAFTTSYPKEGRIMNGLTGCSSSIKMTWISMIWLDKRGKQKYTA